MQHEGLGVHHGCGVFFYILPVLLLFFYSLGLGIPFVLFALGFRRLLGVFAVIRRHSRWVSRIGGALLVIVGLMLVTGLWTDFTNWLRATVGPGEVGI